MIIPTKTNAKNLMMMNTTKNINTHEDYDQVATETTHAIQESSLSLSLPLSSDEPHGIRKPWELWTQQFHMLWKQCDPYYHHNHHHHHHNNTQYLRDNDTKMDNEDDNKEEEENLAEETKSNMDEVAHFDSRLYFPSSPSHINNDNNHNTTMTTTMSTPSQDFRRVTKTLTTKHNDLSSFPFSPLTMSSPSPITANTTTSWDRQCLHENEEESPISFYEPTTRLFSNACKENEQEQPQQVNDDEISESSSSSIIIFKMKKQTLVFCMCLGVFFLFIKIILLSTLLGSTGTSPSTSTTLSLSWTWTCQWLCQGYCLNHHSNNVTDIPHRYMTIHPKIHENTSWNSSSLLFLWNNNPKLQIERWSLWFHERMGWNGSYYDDPNDENDQSSSCWNNNNDNVCSSENEPKHQDELIRDAVKDTKKSILDKVLNMHRTSSRMQGMNPMVMPSLLEPTNQQEEEQPPEQQYSSPQDTTSTATTSHYKNKNKSHLVPNFVKKHIHWLPPIAVGMLVPGMKWVLNLCIATRILSIGVVDVDVDVVVESSDVDVDVDNNENN